MQQKLDNAQVSYTLNGVKHIFPLTINREDTEKQDFLRVGLDAKAPILMSRQGFYIPKDKKAKRG